MTVEEAEPTEAVETASDDSNSTAVGIVLLASAAAVGGFAALSGRKKNS